MFEQCNNVKTKKNQTLLNKQQTHIFNYILILYIEYVNLFIYFTID